MANLLKVWLQGFPIDKTKYHQRYEDRGRIPAKTTRVSHFGAARLQKQRTSRISRVHDSKNDDRLAFRACRTQKPDHGLAFRACTTQKPTTVSHFAPRIQKRPMSRISRLHDSKNDERLAVCACTTQKTTTVSRFALAGLKNRPRSRVSRLHDSKSDQCPAFRACTAPKTTRVSHFPRARLEKRRASNFTHVASPGDDSCEDGAYSLGWFLQTMECFNFRGETSCIISLILLRFPTSSVLHIPLVATATLSSARLKVCTVNIVVGV